MTSKKGSLPLELLVVIVVLFGFTIMAFLGKNIIDDLNTDIQSDADMSAQAKSTSSSMATRLPSIFDAGLALIFILLWIAVLILGFQIDVQPAYFVVALIFLIIVIGIAFLIDNAYTEVIGDEIFSSMPTYFPMTNFIMDKLGIIIALMGGSLLIVLYGKMRG
jgi:hypothetical protein